METQAEIDAHNERTLWDETATHLAAAHHSLGLAQGCLEDLGKLHLSETLAPVIETVELFLSVANTRATA